MAEVEGLLSRYLAGTLSRGEFARRAVALGLGLPFIESLLGPGARHALAAPSPTSAPARHPNVVLVVLDAFRADYLQLTSMPNLSWLMDRGASFPNAWVGQLESYTPTGHATLSTGSTPAHHGVIGFSWRDPKTGKRADTGWYHDVIAGRLEAQMLQHGVDSIPQAVKRQDPRARVVALSSEKYYAADAMGGHAADYILYGLPQGTRVISTGIPHHAPSNEFLGSRGMSRPWPLRLGEFDEMSMSMALESLRAFSPRVLMINLPGADIYGHRVGGPASPDVMRTIASAADAQIGRLIRAYRDRGLLDETIFIVTSDHGMVPNTYQIDDSVIADTVRACGGDYLFHTGGSSAYIWLRNSAAAGNVAQRMLQALPHMPTYDGTDEEAVPFGHYLNAEGGKYQYHPVTRIGTSLDAPLSGALNYLLSTFAGPLAPDIALSYTENMVSTTNPKHHGEHGGATWGAQHVPLILSGPGIRRGVQSTFPARLMDVAPTVLALLGIAPRGMDGVALADILTRPALPQERAQADLAPLLTAYQAAIVARSRQDRTAQTRRRTISRARSDGVVTKS